MHIFDYLVGLGKRGTARRSNRVGPIADQAATINKCPVGVNGGKPMAVNQADDVIAVGVNPCDSGSANVSALFPALPSARPAPTVVARASTG